MHVINYYTLCQCFYHLAAFQSGRQWQCCFLFLYIDFSRFCLSSSSVLSLRLFCIPVVPKVFLPPLHSCIWSTFWVHCVWFCFPCLVFLDLLPLYLPLLSLSCECCLFIVTSSTVPASSLVLCISFVQCFSWFFFPSTYVFPASVFPLNYFVELVKFQSPSNKDSPFVLHVCPDFCILGQKPASGTGWYATYSFCLWVFWQSLLRAIRFAKQNCFIQVRD